MKTPWTILEYLGSICVLNHQNQVFNVWEWLWMIGLVSFQLNGAPNQWVLICYCILSWIFGPPNVKTKVYPVESSDIPNYILGAGQFTWPTRSFDCLERLGHARDSQNSEAVHWIGWVKSRDAASTLWPTTPTTWNFLGSKHGVGNCKCPRLPISNIRELGINSLLLRSFRSGVNG